MSSLSKLEAVFFAALEKGPGQDRAAFLDSECSGDIDLRQRVEKMLAAQASAGSFLEAPPSAIAIDPGPTTAGSAAERPGTQIGPYKLLQEIGQGGMGVVYMAEQHEPVKRRVALKIIKPGMDTRQVIDRFEAERQALSLMDHPNIAKVLDAGTTDSGRPYFVMELVKGQPITQYCDEHHLTPRQRLELLLPVCQAIQHAHQKGIIHRDIKPTNILVAEYDNRPVPKVIDFGVAKAISQSLTEKTIFTGLGQIVGTLEYMSPEQAKVNQLDIDTRSDIYSLGVLLYELLTGSTPLDRQRLRSAAFDEMLRIIREEEPPKPSTRLSDSHDSLPSISAQRHTEPAKLTKLVRGELDWIVMKALEKDRNRRYETANGFAADIERYLADEQVQACPPSASYRLRKFARRNRSGLAVAGLVLFFLVLLGSVGGWAWRDRAARAREAELERTARAAEQANHLERAIERAELLQREGKRGEALAALERAKLLASEAEPTPPLAERIESLQERLDAEGRDAAFFARFEAIRREVTTEVDIEESHFNGRNMYPMLRQALEQYGIVVGVTPLATAATHIQQRPAAIQAVVVAALDESVNRVPSNDSGTREWLIDALQKTDSDPWRNKVRRAWKQPATLATLAKDVDVRQQPPSFLLLVAGALPIKSPSRLDLERRVQFAYPGDFWANHQLGWDLRDAGKDAEAIRYYTAALSLRPDNPGVLLNRANTLWSIGELEAAIVDLQQAIAVAPQYAAAHDNLGLCLHAQKKLPEAIAAHRKAIELDPKLSRAHNNLGNALRDQGKLDEAIAAYRKAIELDPKLSRAHNNLGNALRDQGKLDEAIAAYRKAIELDPKLSRAHNNLGNALRAQGKPDEAIDCYRKAIEIDPKNATAHSNLGLALYQQKKLDEAIAAYRKAIELDPKDAAAYYNLGNALNGQKKLDEAIAAYRKAIELDPKHSYAYVNIGFALYEQKKLDKAIDAYKKAIEFDPRNVGAYNNLGNALRAQGKLDEAIDVFRTATELEPKSADAFNRLGLALNQQKKLDEAIDAFSKAIEIDSKLGAVRFVRGEALCRTGRFHEALEDFDKATELDPNNLQAWYRAAALYLYVGDVERYHRACREMLDRFEQRAAENASIPEQTAKTCALAPDAVPDFARVERLAQRAVTGTEKHAWYGNFVLAKGLTDYRGGHHEQAVEWLKQFTPKPGGNVWDATAFAVLAMAHHRLSHAEEARAALVSARALLIKKPDAQLFDWLHCEILFREAERLMGPVTPQEQSAEAAALKQRQLAEAQEAVRLRPDDPVARAVLAKLLHQQWKLDEAIAAYRKAIELDPNSKFAAGVYFQLGKTLEDQGKLDEAIACFEKAAELNANFALAHICLAWLRTTCREVKLRDAPGGLQAARKAVELAPQSETAWRVLGWARYRTEDWKASIEALEKSCALQHGGDSGQWFFLAMDHWQLGEKDKAREWYDRAVQWTDKNKAGDELLRRFQAEAEALMKKGTGDREQEPDKK